MEVTTTIAEAIAHAAEPHLADLPLERAERYQEGALHLRQVRGNRFMRDRYFVYRGALGPDRFSSSSLSRFLAASQRSTSRARSASSEIPIACLGKLLSRSWSSFSSRAISASRSSDLLSLSFISAPPCQPCDQSIHRAIALLRVAGAAVCRGGSNVTETGRHRLQLAGAGTHDPDDAAGDAAVGSRGIRISGRPHSGSRARRPRPRDRRSSSSAGRPEALRGRSPVPPGIAKAPAKAPASVSFFQQHARESIHVGGHFAGFPMPGPKHNRQSG